MIFKAKPMIMKKSKIIYSLAVFTVLAGLAGGSAYVSASEADADKNTFSKWGQMKNKHEKRFFQNLTEEERVEKKEKMEAKRAEHEVRREARQTALSNEDYNAWVEAVGEDAKILDKINQDNFSRLVEAHSKMDEAKEIFNELGIERGHGFKHFRQN